MAYMKESLLKQIRRFLVVGGTAFLIDFGTLWLLTEAAGINYLLSNVISFTISVVYNYLLSTLWVFGCSKTKSKSFEAIVFIVLSIIGLGINQLLMYVAVELFYLNYLLSKIGATGVVMVFNFITRKRLLETKD